VICEGPSFPGRIREGGTLVKKILVFALLVVSAAAVAAPALADPPQQIEDVVVHNVVTGETDCGTLVWDINIVADITNFFDNEGNRVRQIVHIREDNTITNLTTGETLREGPDSFIQTTYFTSEGPVIVASGLQARVGNELMDVGRVVLLPLGGGRLDLVFSAGQHPVREEADLGTLAAALPAFCAVFE
jgi:hypothetical protein